MRYQPKTTKTIQDHVFGPSTLSPLLILIERTHTHTFRQQQYKPLRTPLLQPFSLLSARCSPAKRPAYNYPTSVAHQLPYGQVKIAQHMVVQKKNCAKENGSQQTKHAHTHGPHVRVQVVVVGLVGRAHCSHQAPSTTITIRSDRRCARRPPTCAACERSASRPSVWP